MKVLVTGGAGYIGSHTVKYLLEHGIEVVVVDNLITGHLESLDLDQVSFYPYDIKDVEAMDRVFSENDIGAVIHFAASSLVGESMSDPALYYDNNVYGTMKLLESMRKHDVDKIVFSSTAATYGEPSHIPILESDPTLPSNPYGETKLAMEKMMHWYDQAYGIKHISLRYFNAAGAHKTGCIGEAHLTETHLIPLVLQVANGIRERIFIFGDDYNTKDGSCIRDYIHVVDLAKAHFLAFDYLKKNAQSDVFNLGNGKGYSVKEVIDVARKVTGHPIPASIEKRRAGDPAVLVASSKKVNHVLKWFPDYDDLQIMIEDAWRWHENHPKGYKK